MSRTERKDQAQVTLRVAREGAYEHDGRRVSLSPWLERCVEGTRVHRPEGLTRLLEERQAGGDGGTPPRVEVTAERTDEAAIRLWRGAPDRSVVLLNFASAKNPGGGFLGGARAQEEDLARASALYPALERASEYYEANRACGTPLYTDHVIHSPAVPFFRDASGAFHPEPVPLSVITAPAPNAGVALERNPEDGPAVRETLRRRAGMVLAVAADEGHRQLVLGPWGCGVFRNDPRVVADVFADWLEGPSFAGDFDTVIFAAWSSKAQDANRRAFEHRFASWRAA